MNKERNTYGDRRANELLIRSLFEIATEAEKDMIIEDLAMRSRPDRAVSGSVSKRLQPISLE